MVRPDYQIKIIQLAKLAIKMKAISNKKYNQYKRAAITATREEAAQMTRELIQYMNLGFVKERLKRKRITEPRLLSQAA